MRLSRLLVFGYGCYILVIASVYLWYGPNANVDFWSISLVCVISAAIAGYLLVLPRRSVALSLWLAIHLFLYYLLPFFGYIMDPDGFPFIRELFFGATSTNRALLMILLGTIALVAGYQVGGFLTLRRAGSRKELQRQQPSATRLWISPSWAFLIGMCFVLVDLKIMLQFASVYGGDAVTEGAWWRRFFSFNPISFIGTIYVLENWRRMTVRDRALVCGPIVLDKMLLVLMGSRSAVAYFGLFILQYYVVRYGNLRLRRGVIGAIAALGLVAIVLFPIGLKARRFWTDVADDPVEERGVVEMVAESLKGAAIGDYLVGPLHRLSNLDMVTVIMDGPVRDFDDNVGWKHDLKAFVNMVVPGRNPFTPGKPFPDVLESSSTFPYLYMGYSKEYFSEYHRLTMPWTLWGLCYVRFGWGGGMVAAFLIGVGSAWLFRKCEGKLSRYYGVYWKMFVFMLAIEWFDNFGFDSWARDIVYFLLPFLVVVPLLALGCRIKRAPTATSQIGS